MTFPPCPCDDLSLSDELPFPPCPCDELSLSGELPFPPFPCDELSLSLDDGGTGDLSLSDELPFPPFPCDELSLSSLEERLELLHRLSQLPLRLLTFIRQNLRLPSLPFGTKMR